MTVLFSPIPLREITARNRLMISPMCQYSADDNGFASEWHLIHYGRFALGGAGLVMVEATAISAQGRISYGDLGIWSDAHIPPLKNIARFLKAQGAVPAIQIGHAGRKACTQRPWHGHGPLGPDDLRERGEKIWQTESVTSEPPAPGYLTPIELSPEMIDRTIRDWAEAAHRAIQAGFETIEIHGAHGYLIHSFLSPLSNSRRDGYGGDLAGRMRFALEVAKSVRAAMPSGLPLFFRISSVDASKTGWSLEDSITLSRELAAIGVDVIDCSSGGIGNDLSVVPRGPGFQVSFSSRIRAEAKVKTAAVGLITDGAQAEGILREGHADLVAIGREALFNPNWPLHVRLALEPEHRFDPWPPQSGWWLNKRKLVSPMPRQPAGKSA